MDDLLSEQTIAGQLFEEIVLEEELVGWSVLVHLNQIVKVEFGWDFDLAKVHLVVVSYHLEGVRGSAAYTDAGALEQTERGVEGNGLGGAKVG